MSAITQYAELAGAEVLVFEIVPERLFGYGDTDIIAPGATDAAIEARANATTALSGGGQAQAQHDAEATGSMNIHSAGSGEMLFNIWAVEKKSADFSMAGAASWSGAGVSYTPHSVLTDDAVRKPVECRHSTRARELRGSSVLAQAKAQRHRESRGLKR